MKKNPLAWAIVICLFLLRILTRSADVVESQLFFLNLTMLVYSGLLFIPTLNAVVYLLTGINIVFSSKTSTTPMNPRKRKAQRVLVTVINLFVLFVCLFGWDTNRKDLPLILSGQVSQVEGLVARVDRGPGMKAMVTIVIIDQETNEEVKIRHYNKRIFPGYCVRAFYYPNSGMGTVIKLNDGDEIPENRSSRHPPFRRAPKSVYSGRHAVLSVLISERASRRF